MKTTLTTILLAAATTVAGAQTVYRCGDTYSQQPCPNAKTMQLDPTRKSFDGAAQARAVSYREGKMADAMEKARLKEEARPTQVFIPKAKPVSTSEDKHGALMTKPGKPQYFTAVAPGETKKKKK